MKKHNLVGAFLLILMLICGCANREEKGDLELLFSTAETSFQTGRFFFAGQVQGIKNDERLITYYDAPMGKNTFYSVKVTEDFFGCMPERNITVCILGNSETFPNRATLEKGKEYLFETALWVDDQEAIFLLPTFYSALPRLADGKLYALEAGKELLCGSLEDYKITLMERAEEQKYAPATLLSGMKEQLKNAVSRKDVAYFKERDFKNVEKETLQKTAHIAATLLKKAEDAEATWEEIGAIIQ